MSTDSNFVMARDQLLAIASSHGELAQKLHVELARLLDCLRANSTGASECQQQERVMLDDLLRDFHPENSRPFLFFKENKWTDLAMPQLVSIAELFAKDANIPIDREAKRRKGVLFKWLDDHWDALLPYAQELRLEFDQIPDFE